MSKEFQVIVDQLHDARIFGLFFDTDRELFKFDFYIYVQLFDDFEHESYDVALALLFY